MFIILFELYLSSKYFPASKCKDTNPVVENDEMFPYNDKHLANLTLAQVKVSNNDSK